MRRVTVIQRLKVEFLTMNGEWTDNAREAIWFEQREMAEKMAQSLQADDEVKFILATRFEPVSPSEVYEATERRCGA